MIPEEKVIEIKKKLRRGYPQGDLINELFSEGYTNDEIQEALFNLSEKTKSGSTTPNTPLWYLASIGLIILGITIVSFKHLWIYPYGFPILALGLIGFCVKHLVYDPEQKK
jgi:hypothetical protein